MLQRAQIILDAETRFDLESLSQETGRSMSDLIREMLKEQIHKHKGQMVKGGNGVKTLRKLVKNAVKGPGDGEYDKYTYNF